MSDTESVPGCQTAEPVAEGPVAPEGEGEAAKIRPGDTIGRYQIQSLLGKGGMGQVFAALDPELGRAVALKLVRSDRMGSSARSRARLLREAQTLAKLQHPNVVAIHDAGAEGDQLFIAMELIAGQTLGEWLGSAARPWRATVDVFVAAGRGLAAAHAVGIVHRDFKPSNVVVGTERVVVVDFGLARPHGDADASDADSSGPVFDVELTLTGERIGTLRYMAPEQHTGAAISPQTDQFAFAVALWEALYGIPPFSGKNSAEMLRDMRQGPPVPPLDRKVPERLRVALARALAVEPGRRWPSLDGLLAVLDRSRAVRGRRFALGAVAVALMAAAFIGGRQQAAAPSCDAGTGLAAEVWSPAARTRIQTAFRSTGRPYADEIYQRIDAAMKTKLDAWAAAHRETCEATHVRHEQSEARLDLRMGCLGRARAELSTLATLLADPSDAAVDHALRAVAETGDFSGCADISALKAAGAQPRDPATLAVVGERVRVSVLDSLGRAKEAVAASRALVERARSLGDALMLAEAMSLAMKIETNYGDASRVPELAHDALRAAEEARDDRLVARSIGAEAADLGVRQQRFTEAVRLFRIAEAALLRAGDVPDTAFAILYDEGNLFDAENQPSFALSRFAAALAVLCSRGDCADRPKLPFVLQAMASDEGGLGETARARALMERALVLLERTRRKEDPLNAALLTNLGNMESHAGELDAAIANHERALSVLEAALGPDHPMVALILTNLADPLIAQGRYAEARAHAERALRIRETQLAADDPTLVATLQTLAAIALGEGKLTEARSLADRSLAVGKSAFGADSDQLIESHEVLAGVALARGLPAQAKASAERALALCDTRADDAVATRARILRLQARALAAEHHGPEALASLARAQSLDPAANRAEALLADAEVLIAVGQPQRALALLEAPGAEKPGILGERARKLRARALQNTRHGGGATLADKGEELQRR